MGKFTDYIGLGFALARHPNRIQSLYRDFKHNQQSKLFTKLASENIVRTAQQIKDWREALDLWEQADNPSRDKMMELYQEIELDDQVVAKTGMMQKKIKSTEFYLFDTDSEEEIKKLLPIFNKRWFTKFLDWASESELYGHSLIQFGDWDLKKGYVHKDMELVFRHLVSPEMGIVRFNIGNTDGVPFRTGPYAPHLVEIGENVAKGLFAAIAPLYIFKKNALIFWQDFQQRYGEPVITFNTDITNEKNVERLLDFAQNRGRNSAAIMDTHEVANLLEAEKTDAFRVYHEMILLNNDGISKIIGGETMTTDSSDGKYKGDVHADTALLFHLGRLKDLGFYINDELLPKMRKDGFPIGDTVEFRWREFGNVDAIVNRLVKLLIYYKIEPDLVYELTGIKVGEEREILDARAGNSKTAPDKDDK